MNLKSNYDEIRDLTKLLFREQLQEAEQAGYLVVYKDVYYDHKRRSYIAEVDLVKERILYPMRIVKRPGVDNDKF